MADDPDLDWITSELRGAAHGERAPTHLRLRLDAMGQSAAATGRPPRRATRRRVLISLTGLLAAAAIAVALVLPGGAPGGPTVAQAAAVGIQPLTYSPPPAQAYRAAQTKRYARFAAVRFPRGLGIWNFESWRIARLAGRRILTLYYAHGDDQISYSVAASPVLSGQRPGFSSFRLEGRTVVSWRESNHSCLLSSAQLPRTMLLALARS